jgi:predicted transporter
MARRYYVLAFVLGGLGVAGWTAASPVLGIVETTPVLNAVHLALAVAVGLAATRGLGTMRRAGQWVGILLVTFAVMAFAEAPDAVEAMLPFSDINGGLHLLLGLTFLYHAWLAPPTL